MEDRQNDALLERVSNGEPVYEPPRRNSNLKAVKVTGLTVLACLLLAGQAFTAYYVMAQKDHLKALETGQDSLKKELTRRLSVSGPKMVHTPMSKMPLLLNLNEDGTKTESKMPLRKLTPSFPSQREGSGLAEGSSARLAMPMASLPILTNEKLDEDSKATELPAMVVVEPRCKLEAGKVMPGFFQPKCDAEGNFKPMQCWHSTGYCWCVDKNGKEIAGTLQRGRPECNNEN